MNTPAPPQPRGQAWHLVLGLALWLAWFGVTYGGVAIACEVAAPAPAAGALTWINAVVLLLAAGSSLAFGLAARASARQARRASTEAAGQRQRFLGRAACMLYAIAAVSTVVVALPAGLLAPCL